MIGHEAIANQRHLVEGNILQQQLKVNRTISIAIQHQAPSISALRQMVWNIRGNNPSQSSHNLTQYQAVAGYMPRDCLNGASGSSYQAHSNFKHKNQLIEALSRQRTQRRAVQLLKQA